MKNIEEIKNIALKIVEAEQNILLDINVKANEQKIENIMSSLNFEEMLLLDMYISKNNLLTK